jgi:hypothetical protein
MSLAAALISDKEFAHCMPEIVKLPLNINCKGLVVGLLVGFCVGAFVGFFVGTLVGGAVGFFVGA